MASGVLTITQSSTQTFNALYDVRLKAICIGHCETMSAYPKHEYEFNLGGVLRHVPR